MQTEEMETVDGVADVCQHPRMQYMKPKMVASKTSDTGGFTIGKWYCPDCDDYFGTFVNGTPMDVVTIPLVSMKRMKAEAAVTSAKKKREEHSEGKQPDPSLARSKIERNGLKAGTVAPGFKLPLANGSAEVALADYFGQRVVLLFSDPNCAPCDAVVPEVQAAHERGVKVLMISRRDAAATVMKAAKLGLTFPIVMQKAWEISLKYGKFATPMMYVVGPDGTLETDVISGSKEIPVRLRGMSG